MRNLSHCRPSRPASRRPHEGNFIHSEKNARRARARPRQRRCCGMRARWGLPILQVVVATSMSSMVSAMPLPEGDTTQSAGVESAGDAVISGKSAADDLANIKDEARLPVEEPEGPASAKPRGPIEPKAVPELSRAEFCSTLAASAEKHKVPVPLFANLIWQESRFQPRAVSRVGAMGVAQFMPQVAQEVGLKN